MNKIRFLLTLLVLFSSSLLQAASPTSVGEWLDCWADAIGGRERLAGIHVIDRSGTFESSGLEGTFRLVSTSDGRLRSDVAAGAFTSSESVGNGGGWSKTASAPSHDLTDADLARLVTDAYTESFSMFFEDRMDGKVRLVSSDTSEAILEILPDGGIPMKIWLDAKSCRPKRTEAPDRDRSVTTTIDSWMELDGIQFPKEIRQSRGDAKFDDLIHIEHVSFSQAVDETLFEAPAEQTEVLPREAISIPFELTENHIYVPVVISGEHEAMFILDTGADFTVIEKAFAESKGLDMQGGLEVRGAGESSVEAALVPNPGLRIGNAEVPSEYMVAVPLGPLSLREGRPIQGILGYDVLSRFVVEIDYAGRTIHLHPPDRFAPPPDAAAFKVRFDGNTPTINGTIVVPGGRSIDVNLTLDTGNRTALVLHRPFVERERIRDHIGSTIDAPVGMGVGGATSQDLGRIDSLRLGSFEIDNPLVSLSRDIQGANANPDLDGNLGGEVLRRFSVWIDYRNTRILLRPNGNFDEAFEYDMAGVLISATNDRFVQFQIQNVLAGSPAAEAGLREGDLLVEVDGIAAAKIGLEKLRMIFRREGRDVNLRVQRGEETIEMKLTTRRLI